MIWKYTLPTHDKIKSKLLDIIENYEPVKEYPDTISKTDFYDSGKREYWNILNEGLEPLWKEISNKYWVKEWYSKLWFQQYCNNDFHGWHLHSEASVSMSYLLELPDPRYSTEFVDNKNNKRFQLNVCEGDVIIFPSYTIHRAPIIKSDIRKTTIAINLNFKEPNLNKIHLIDHI
tara:strand:+ start:168 stop:692 length:525 start_codon:yes stop_codon:yes gene_type:complete